GCTENTVLYPLSLHDALPIYVQTGEAGTDRQLEKERFMAALAHRMATLTDRDAVVCGDWNIAHTENDIKNWRGNVKKSGFLPAEDRKSTRLNSSHVSISYAVF